MGQVRDIAGSRREVSWFLPAERVDTYKTTFTTDCYRGSFDQELPLVVWQHRLEEPIGRVVGVDYDGTGAYPTAKFSNFDDVPLARRAFSQIEDGTITDVSFGFKDAESRAHPELKGVRQIYRASMKELSPVSVGSIPGAKATGVREDELVTDISDPGTIAALVNAKVLTPEAGQAILLKDHPELREHITLVARSEQPVTATDVRNALEESHPDLALRVRDMAIELLPPGERRGVDDTAGELMQGIDAALDKAQAVFEGADPSALPADVQQGIKLVLVAGEAVDELLEEMGVPDIPDDASEAGEMANADAGRDDGDLLERAVWSSAEQDKLPDSSFAYIEPNTTKDGSGKTIPRNKRHFPIRDASGKADAPHVRNALARIAQGAEFGKEALPKVKAAAKEAGVEVGNADDESRAQDALERLARRSRV